MPMQVYKLHCNHVTIVERNVRLEMLPDPGLTLFFTLSNLAANCKSSTGCRGSETSVWFTSSTTFLKLKLLNSADEAPHKRILIGFKLYVNTSFSRL